MNTLVSRTVVRLATGYLVCAAPAFVFLRGYLGEPDVYGRAALVALPLAIAVMYVLTARGCLAEEKLLLGAIERPVLKDGERVAATGPVEALGPLLTSPFSRHPCVVYQYRIYHIVHHPGHPPREVQDFWGMAVTPHQILTPAGGVRVRGYARLEGGATVFADEDEAYRAAQAWLDSTAFRHPASAGERYGSLAEPIDTEADTFRDDVRSKPETLDLEQRVRSTGRREYIVTEQRLDVGQTVCAMGEYSAEKQALVPSRSGIRQLRISTASPQLWAASSREEAGTMYRWAAGFAVVGLAAALALRWF